MTASPTCPHGITLDKFCEHLHLPDQTPVEADAQPACPHGISLDLFCRKLHGGPR